MIDPRVIADIEQSLVGSAQTLETALEGTDLTVEEVEKTIAERGEIELCSTCGWWCETSELELVNDELICEECRT